MAPKTPSSRENEDARVCRSAGAPVRSFDEASRSFEVVASTSVVDSYDEIVAQNWDLTRFAANPVVLYAHQSRELPIGTAEAAVKNGQLEARITLVSEKANPKAQQVLELIREGALRAVSVGFMPRDVRFEKRDGREVFVLDNNELWEISVVPVPANPEALAKMRARAIELAQQETEPMAMTAEEKQAFDKAHSEAHAATERAAALERELAAEKAANAQLDKELKSASERAAKAEASVIEVEVGKHVGSKLIPAEKDEWITLAKDIGLERVKSMLDKRPALALTQRATVGDDPVGKSELAPEPADAGGASQKLSDLAFERANA